MYNLTLAEEEALNDLLSSNYSITYALTHRLWLTIFKDWLVQNNKKLRVAQHSYFFKQSDLDNHWPTSNSEEEIAVPFEYDDGMDYITVMFINTKNGIKIYEYADALENTNKFKGYQNLSVALTKHDKHRVKILKNLEANTIFVLTNDLNSEFMESAMALFPYFIENNSLLNDEFVMNCCKAAAKNEDITEYLQELASKVAEINKNKEKTLLKNVINDKNSRRQDQIKGLIEDYRSDIATYEDRIKSYYENIQNLLNESLGIETQKTVDDSKIDELLEFINKNKYIKGIKVYQSGSYVYARLNICAPINIYETEPLERILKHKYETVEDTSYLNIYKVLEEIFVKENYTMICQTLVKIDFSYNSIEASRHAIGMAASQYEMMPQPHLTRYNCWGENKEGIIKDLQDKNLTSCFVNMLIAAQNINFTDTTVLYNWVSDMVQYPEDYLTKKCLIRKSDNEMVSISDIIDTFVDKPVLIDTLEEDL